ncbi:Tau class glutathione S-transferase [Dorcoceras hygrometricum]|uniref:Tau class glutathione S-transferase n=1 Tax=Dorcoceras hygrometricum TaxID=472368 RepID=A0A2Z7D085_9LAMI|nr:Tau class glutathione S-transferase [Dorcoceras hygrometricum]
MTTLLATRAWLRPDSRGNRHFTVDGGRLRQSGPRPDTRLLRQPALEGLTRSTRTDSPRRVGRNRFRQLKAATAAACLERRRRLLCSRKPHSPKSSSYAQHIELSITDSACKNQLVVVSIQYGPFNPYIPIRSMTTGKSRVAKDPIAMRTSWRSNSDIASVTRVSMTFRVVRTNQYNQDLGLIHSTNGNHLESPNEVSRGNRHFTVDGGRLRQSGPRPDTRLLRQPALEDLTRSVRTDSPRRVGRNRFRQLKAAAAACLERRRRLICSRFRVCIKS